MISAGSIKNVGNDSVRSIIKLAHAGLKGVEAKVKEVIVKAITDFFHSENVSAPQYTSQATTNRAKGFGSAASYIVSEAEKVASKLSHLPLPIQGAVLAGIVKTVFSNEGEKNE